MCDGDVILSSKVTAEMFRRGQEAEDRGRGGEGREKKKDGGKTISKISWTQCTQGLQEGSSTMICRFLGCVVAGQ